MVSQRVLILEQQLIEDVDYIHPRNPPKGFVSQAAALPDKDAMTLAARLFMMSEWRYIWMAVIIFQKHPTARTMID